MKLEDFVPDLASQNHSLEKANHIIKNAYEGGFVDFAKSMSGGGFQKSSPSPLGIEQLYFDWLRTAYAYRRMFIQDLYLLAFDVAEIRIPILALRGEIFRKGLDEWIPVFILKCKQCGEEYQEKVEKCDRCGSKELRKPNKKQVEYFDSMKLSCNIFGQTFEEILKITSDDVSITDDLFILLQKEYMLMEDQLWSKVVEIRRLHPALVEYDLDKNGLPRNSHFICPFHREEVDAVPSICPECGFERMATMYIYNHRGRRVYLFEDEVVHSSKFSPSESYGYCYDDQTQILTKQRGWQLFKDLTDEDCVATLNPHNDELVYQKPTTNWSQDYNGKMYEVNGKTCVSLKVTPNHKHYAKLNGGNAFELVEAKELFHKKYLHKIGGATWNGKEQEFFLLPRADFYKDVYWKDKNVGEEEETNLVHCPELTLKMDVFLEFLGYYLSEGNLTRPEKRSGQVCISQSYQVNYKKWVKIKECLEKLGFRYRYYGHKFVINDDRLHKYLKQFGKCHDKFISEEFKDLSQRQLRILFEALMLGDGHWDYRRPTKGVYTSTSLKLRNDISEIMIKLGYSVRIDGWKVGFSTKSEYGGKKTEFNDKMVDYVGKIYCCEVPEYHILLVKRNARTIFSGNSPLLTVMQKVLTISGMDRYLYRYFFERKMPSGLILTYTDDPQSLEIERARIESKMMEDPTYMPWIGVSQKTGKGRTDFVKLFHTLAEMDYLPVRNEIRDRIAAIYGVPQMYMNIMEGVGPMAGASQQVKIFANVIESDQRRYNEKIFPQIMQAFHITDWKLKLKTPEEKVESIILQQAQQKVAIATQMMTLGFTVDLKPGAENIENIDFTFSGKAQNPMMAAMAGGGAGAEGSQGGEGAEGGASGNATVPPQPPSQGVAKSMDGVRLLKAGPLGKLPIKNNPKPLKNKEFNRSNPVENDLWDEDKEAKDIYAGDNLEGEI